MKKERRLNPDKVIETVFEMVKNQEELKGIRKLLKPVSISDVARQYKCSRQAINFILRKNGLTIRGIKEQQRNEKAN